MKLPSLVLCVATALTVFPTQATHDSLINHKYNTYGMRTTACLGAFVSVYLYEAIKLRKADATFSEIVRNLHNKMFAFTGYTIWEPIRFTFWMLIVQQFIEYATYARNQFLDAIQQDTINKVPKDQRIEQLSTELAAHKQQLDDTIKELKAFKSSLETAQQAQAATIAAQEKRITGLEAISAQYHQQFTDRVRNADDLQRAISTLNQNISTIKLDEPGALAQLQHEVLTTGQDLLRAVGIV